MLSVIYRNSQEDLLAGFKYLPLPSKIHMYSYKVLGPRNLPIKAHNCIHC